MKRLYCALLILSTGCRAEDLQIAVASNFAAPLQELITVFKQKALCDVAFSPGSTGKLYAQILNHAPFDLFLAADAERPRLLEEQGLAVEGSRFTYAIGSLVLWSPDPDRVCSERTLSEGDFRYLAIANPELAPYGLAAREALRNLGLWDRLQPKLVRGANISQTIQYVQTGAAELGFVALAQIQNPGATPSGSYWIPPAESYPAIDQQAVLLKKSAEAEAFLAFLKTEPAQQLIRSYGYTLPVAGEADVIIRR